MIKVTVRKNKGEYEGIYCIGHAEYADPGEDIVCSAVSVLVINTLNSIEAFTEDPFSVGTDEERGMIDFVLEGEVSHDTHLLIDSLVLGIQQIVDTYTDKYVSFTTEEV